MLPDGLIQFYFWLLKLSIQSSTEQLPVPGVPFEISFFLLSSWMNNETVTPGAPSYETALVIIDAVFWLKSTEAKISVDI